MNQKVAKMLHRYAVMTGQNVKELKRWWNSLSWLERSMERKRILESLEQAEQTAKSPEESETTS